MNDPRTKVNPKYKRYKANAIENKGPEIRGLRVPKEYHNAIKNIINELFSENVTVRKINSTTNKLIAELLK